MFAIIFFESVLAQVRVWKLSRSASLKTFIFWGPHQPGPLTRKTLASWLSTQRSSLEGVRWGLLCLQMAWHVRVAQLGCCQVASLHFGHRQQQSVANRSPVPSPHASISKLKVKQYNVFIMILIHRLELHEIMSSSKILYSFSYLADHRDELIHTISFQTTGGVTCRLHTSVWESKVYE